MKESIKKGKLEGGGKRDSRKRWRDEGEDKMHNK